MEYGDIRRMMAKPPNAAAGLHAGNRNRFQMQVRSAMRSHPGRIRSENQDCCAAAPELGIYAVADGMGGAAGGELASNLALEAFLQRIGQAGMVQADGTAISIG